MERARRLGRPTITLPPSRPSRRAASRFASSKRPRDDAAGLSARCGDACAARRAPRRHARMRQARALLRGQFPRRCASRSSARRKASSPATTSRSSRARAFPIREFNVPLYRRPRDLVRSRAQARRRRFPNKGAPVGRLNAQERDRALLRSRRHRGRRARRPESRNLLAQGSVRRALRSRSRAPRACSLEDGTLLRVNYDAHNGYPYTRGRPHPDRAQARAARRNVDGPHPGLDGRQSRRGARSCAPPTAPSCSSASPACRTTASRVGAQGVPLTPCRSIAVDKHPRLRHAVLHRRRLPIESAQAATPFRRLMIAQDTGSAIVGPARADLYLGAGDEAGRIAGPHPPSRPLRDAAAARARHGRGRQAHAAAGAEAEDPRRRAEEGRQQGRRQAAAGRRARATSRRRRASELRWQGAARRERGRGHERGPRPAAAAPAQRGRSALLWGRITRSVVPLRKRCPAGRAGAGRASRPEATPPRDRADAARARARAGVPIARRSPRQSQYRASSRSIAG